MYRLMDVEETDPTKQGLKPNPCLRYVSHLGVEETDPTKQGLKLEILISNDKSKEVEETDPTKQGLKPSRCVRFWNAGRSKRPIQQNKD